LLVALPLIAEQEFHSGLVRVHPRAVTFGLTGDYIGQRAAKTIFNYLLAAFLTAGAMPTGCPLFGNCH